MVGRNIPGTSDRECHPHLSWNIKHFVHTCTSKFWLTFLTNPKKQTTLSVSSTLKKPSRQSNESVSFRFIELRSSLWVNTYSFWENKKTPGEQHNANLRYSLVVVGRTLYVHTFVWSFRVEAKLTWCASMCSNLTLIYVCVNIKSGIFQIICLWYCLVWPASMHSSLLCIL